MGQRVTKADEIHLAVSWEANTLSWPVKKSGEANTLSWPVKKIMRGQHVELASKKKRDNIWEARQPMCDHRLKMFYTVTSFRLTGNTKCFLSLSISSGILLWHGWLLCGRRLLVLWLLRHPCHRLLLSADSRCLSLQTPPIFVQSFLGLPAWSLRSKLSPLGLVFG